MGSGTITDVTGSEWFYEPVSRDTVLMWQRDGQYDEKHKLEYQHSTVKLNAGNGGDFWSQILTAMDSYGMALIVNTN